MYRKSRITVVVELADWQCVAWNHSEYWAKGRVDALKSEFNDIAHTVRVTDQFGKELTSFETGRKVD